MDLQPSNFKELLELCEHHAKSGFFGTITASQVLVLALAGRDLGFSYSQAIRAFHLIKGRPCLTADAMVGVCIRSPKCEYFSAVEQSDDRAIWRAKRVGCDEMRYEFSISDAQKAGLLASDMYRRHPRRMLSARAKAFLARDVFPELLMGLIEDGEAEEIAAQSQPLALAPAPAPTIAQIAEAIPVAPALGEAPAIEAAHHASVRACATIDALNALWRDLARIRQRIPKDELDALKSEFVARKRELSQVQS